MPVDSIGAVQNATANVTQQAAIGQDDLFQILLTQLNYQDPLKPMDNQEFIAQLAQFTALEQTREQTEKMDAMLAMLSVNQAVSLLGKTVEARLESSLSVGQVVALDMVQGSPLISLRTAGGDIVNEIKLSQVQLITQP